MKIQRIIVSLLEDMREIQRRNIHSTTLFVSNIDYLNQSSFRVLSFMSDAEDIRERTRVECWPSVENKPLKRFDAFLLNPKALKSPSANA